MNICFHLPKLLHLINTCMILEKSTRFCGIPGQGRKNTSAFNLLYQMRKFHAYPNVRGKPCTKSADTDARRMNAKFITS